MRRWVGPAAITTTVVAAISLGVYLKKRETCKYAYLYQEAKRELVVWNQNSKEDWQPAFVVRDVTSLLEYNGRGYRESVEGLVGWLNHFIGSGESIHLYELTPLMAKWITHYHQLVNLKMSDEWVYDNIYESYALAVKNQNWLEVDAWSRVALHQYISCNFTHETNLIKEYDILEIFRDLGRRFSCRYVCAFRAALLSVGSLALWPSDLVRMCMAYDGRDVCEPGTLGCGCGFLGVASQSSLSLMWEGRDFRLSYHGRLLSCHVFMQLPPHDKLVILFNHFERGQPVYPIAHALGSAVWIPHFLKWCHLSPQLPPWYTTFFHVALCTCMVEVLWRIGVQVVRRHAHYTLGPSHSLQRMVWDIIRRESSCAVHHQRGAKN